MHVRKQPIKWACVSVRVSMWHIFNCRQRKQDDSQRPVCRRGGRPGGRQARLVGARGLEKQAYDWTLASLAARSTGKMWRAEEDELHSYRWVILKVNTATVTLKLLSAVLPDDIKTAPALLMKAFIEAFSGETCPAQEILQFVCNKNKTKIPQPR